MSFLCCLLYCILQLDCWHSPYFVVVLIIVGGTDGQTQMVVFFLGVGVRRNVGHDVWVILNGGWRRDERGMKKEGGVGSLYHLWMVVVKEFFLSWRCGVVKSMSQFCCCDCVGIGFGGDGSGSGSGSDDGGGGGSDGRCTGGLSWFFFCHILTIDFYFFFIQLYIYINIELLF